MPDISDICVNFGGRRVARDRLGCAGFCADFGPEISHRLMQMTRDHVGVAAGEGMAQIVAPKGRPGSAGDQGEAGGKACVSPFRQGHPQMGDGLSS